MKNKVFFVFAIAFLFSSMLISYNIKHSTSTLEQPMATNDVEYSESTFGKYRDENKNTEIKQGELIEEKRAEIPKEQNDEPTYKIYPETFKYTPVEIKPAEIKHERVIFIGDSRTVQMHIAVFGTYSTPTIEIDSNNDGWVCQGAMGLKWMKEHEADIENMIIPNTAIIMNMGTNDAYSWEYVASQYADYLNSKVSYWEQLGGTVYFMTTNPVDDSGAANWTGLRDEHVFNFNNAVKELLDNRIIYLDSYSYLKEIGFDAVQGDGVHYQKNTYLDLYNYVKNNV